MATKVFIDGEHGTTGLQIQKRLAMRKDIELISLAHDDRHNVQQRLECLDTADIAILCLPDDAARDAIKMLGMNSNTRIIDSSTAHRVANDWTYGFAEMTKGQKERICEAKYVANPGCYSTGAIAILRPLTDASFLRSDYPVSINAVSGYTGGGKHMIAQMEDPACADPITSSYFIYGLNLKHKHVPEIRMHGRLTGAPLFVPSVGRFPQGMIVNVPLHKSLFEKSITSDNIRTILEEHYQGQNVITVATKDESAQINRIDPETLANTDHLKIYVFGNDVDGIYNICAVFDNLGKGASGAAVQNLNLMIGN